MDLSCKFEFHFSRFRSPFSRQLLAFSVVTVQLHRAHILFFFRTTQLGTPNWNSINLNEDGLRCECSIFHFVHRWPISSFVPFEKVSTSTHRSISYSFAFDFLVVVLFLFFKCFYFVDCWTLFYSAIRLVVVRQFSFSPGAIVPIMFVQCKIMLVAMPRASIAPNTTVL